MARRGSFRSQLEEKRPGSVSVAPIPILIIGVICIFIGLFVLLPIFPPVGIAWCALVGKCVYDGVKQAMKNSNVDHKAEWRTAVNSSREAVRRYASRVKEEDAMEERRPQPHSHTLVNYCYDQCAAERRLDQLKALKQAGIIDETEYRTRREGILAGK